MCCGQKRLLLSGPAVLSRPRFVAAPAGALNGQPNFAGGVSTPSAAVSPSPPVSPNPGEVAVRYLRAAPVRVRGLVTGRSYEFPGPQATADVDSRDAPGLINTGQFRPLIHRR